MFWNQLKQNCLNALKSISRFKVTIEPIGRTEIWYFLLWSKYKGPTNTLLSVFVLHKKYSGDMPGTFPYSIGLIRTSY